MPNPNLTIRDFFIAVGEEAAPGAAMVMGGATHALTAEDLNEAALDSEPLEYPSPLKCAPHLTPSD